MNRRRILTGIIAAPFVARMGILMPVRPVLASGGWVSVTWETDFEWGWVSRPDPSVALLDTLKKMETRQIVTASSPQALKLFIEKYVDLRSLSADGNLRAEIRIDDRVDRLHRRA